ncbi:unnamed protein product [Cladocopium goreaui]|uniref:Uncharacterized protein n=1 Tax=Cladocopium goreaui TaxID=2562237 RepID=A0A9P1GKQ4_9DINO|nr:unnamed protein product [Cladocopium goreaui]
MEPPRQGAAEAGAQRWATRTEVAEETFQGVDPGAITGCQEKAAAPAAGASQDAVPREELFRRIEAQETVEEERPSETHVFAAAERSLGSLEAELESHQDETRSLASLTEPTSLLEGRRVTRFDETSTLEADLEVVNEEETGRNVLQDLFADEPWRLQLCGDAFGELKQLGSTQQKALVELKLPWQVVLEVLKTLASGTWPELWKKEVGKPQGEQTSMCYRLSGLSGSMVWWSAGYGVKGEEE